jgi:hypothetical protein
MKLLLGSVTVLGLLSLGACSNADMAQMGAMGSPAHIQCFSGGVLILDATSTGKVSTENESDGWYFEDAATHRLVRVSGDCVIKN